MRTETEAARVHKLVLSASVAREVMGNGHAPDCHDAVRGVGEVGIPPVVHLVS